MAEDDIFDPLGSETQGSAVVSCMKTRGPSDGHLLDFNLERYVDDFNRRVIGAYQDGNASAALPADIGAARSLIPPGTGALRDFSYIAPEIPEFDAQKCVGCMTCVTA